MEGGLGFRILSFRRRGRREGGGVFFRLIGGIVWALGVRVDFAEVYGFYGFFVRDNLRLIALWCFFECTLKIEII